MTVPTEKYSLRWLTTGDAIFAAVLASIGAARASVRLETYIFGDDQAGRGVLGALVAAAGRGCAVQVLIDAVGSQPLSDHFWDPLRAVGGEVRWFNRSLLQRLPIRDHRKLVVIDDTIAFLGGFNFTEAYTGDGVTCGWRDIGLELRGEAVPLLRATFDEMFRRCETHVRLWKRFQRRQTSGWKEEVGGVSVLPTGPGSGQSVFQRRLTADLAHARHVQFASPYFLPGVRLRRRLRHVVRRGGRVQIVVPGMSDVPVAQRAARFLYAGLLRAGVEIYEYQPRMMHAKLYRIGDVLYFGSANLDTRSLYINYEIMVRTRDPGAAGDAGHFFEDLLAHSRPVKWEEWRVSRSLWTRMREQWAYFLLARLDPYLSRHFVTGEWQS